MTPEAEALLDKLVDAVHARFDMVVIPDAIEVPVIKGIIKMAVEFLPPMYIGWLQSAADGIDDTEAASLKAWLVTLLDKYGTSVPAIFRSTVAGVIVEALRKGDAVIIGS